MCGFGKPLEESRHYHKTRTTTSIAIIAIVAALASLGVVVVVTVVTIRIQQQAEASPGFTKCALAHSAFNASKGRRYHPRRRK